MTSPGQPRIGFTGRQPTIDYVTKDFAGFRQGMLNQIPLLPMHCKKGWEDSSVR